MSTSAPYRSPADRDPPTVIDYRHLSPVWGWVVTVGALLLLVLGSHRVVLQCTREADGAGYCQSRDEHVSWKTEGARIPLAKLKEARMVRGSKGATRVALVTDEGTVQITTLSESWNTHEKVDLIEGLGRFLYDRSAPRFEGSYGSPWASNLVSAVCLLPLIALFAFQTRRVRVVVDGASRQVRVQRSRFPLSPSEEDYELDAISGAEVEERTKGKAPSYRVALILAGGVRVPLTSGYSSGRGAKDRTAARIIEALRVAKG